VNLGQRNHEETGMLGLIHSRYGLFLLLTIVKGVIDLGLIVPTKAGSSTYKD